MNYITALRWVCKDCIQVLLASTKTFQGSTRGGFKRGSKFSETAAGFNVEVFSLISAISLNPAKTLNTVS